MGENVLKQAYRGFQSLQVNKGHRALKFVFKLEVYQIRPYSNRGLLEFEANSPPTEPQTLPSDCNVRYDETR